jgi:hypothetical protein
VQPPRRVERRRELASRYTAEVMSYRVRDVVLHVADPDDRMLSLRPTRADTLLGHDVRLTQVEKSASNYIIELCNPHRLRRAPSRLLVVRYAFVREQSLPYSANPFEFDADGRLNAAMAISRLVHPTAIGFEHSARLILNDAGGIAEALPGHIKGMASFAYVAGTDVRNWLTDVEAADVPRLFNAFVVGEASLPGRIKRAIWRHEYASRSEYLDIRWLHVVSALEALLKLKYPYPTPRGSSRPPGSTKQFVGRTVNLAARYAARGLTWTALDAEDAYENRSDVAHGLSLTQASPTLDRYARMETLLRHALVEALTSASFANTFQSDAAVDAAWPA